MSERRHDIRYEVKLSLDYCAITEDAQVRQGRGITAEMSHRAVRFTADSPLPAGTSIQLFIEWPAGPGGRLLLLRTAGYILRSRSVETVALISRHVLGEASEVRRLAVLPKRTGS